MTSEKFSDCDLFGKYIVQPEFKNATDFKYGFTYIDKDDKLGILTEDLERMAKSIDDLTKE